MPGRSVSAFGAVAPAPTGDHTFATVDGTWSFFKRRSADDRLLHAAPPLTLRPHHSKGLPSRVLRYGTGPQPVQPVRFQNRLDVRALERCTSAWHGATANTSSCYSRSPEAIATAPHL